MSTRRRTNDRSVRAVGGWDNLFVIFGSAVWDANRLGSQFLAHALRLHGPVLYVDPPMSVARTARARPLGAGLRSRLEVVEPGLARLRIVALPMRRGPVVQAVTQLAVRRSVRRAVGALGGSVRAVLSGRVLYHPFGACGERWKVFRVSDDFTAGAALFGIAKERLVDAELRLARDADLIACVSQPLMEKWRSLGFHPVLIPNGCDVDFLGRAAGMAAPDDVDLPRPIVGYIGHLASRIDFALLRAVAHESWSLLLVGPWRADLPRDALADLLDRPNVRWLGAKPYDSMPAYLGAMDVGLVPYAHTAFNEASFPLKTLEYLAAGLPVVSTDLPAVRWLNTDLVRTADDPKGFVVAVEAALKTAGDATERDRRRAFASRHSWASRAASYVSALEALEADHTPG